MTLIEIIDYHEPIDIGKVFIEQHAHTAELPQDVRARVDSNWQEFSKTHTGASDTFIAYLSQYAREDHPQDNHHLDSQMSLRVATAPYRISQWLNRDDKKGIDTSIANALQYNPLATWILPISGSLTDVYMGRATALFGNKIDFGSKKVSGFGGFTKPEDTTIYFEGAVSPVHWADRKLREEAGRLGELMPILHACGLNYIPNVGTKGYDLILLAQFQESPEELQKLMRDNAQFKKQLIPVPFTPHDLVDFLKSDTWEPTTSCIGGVGNVVRSVFGKEEYDIAFATYPRAQEIRIHPEAGETMVSHTAGKD